MALTPNEAYAAKQPFVDKETLEHIVEQFPTPFHLYDEAGIRRNMQEVRDAFAWNPGFKEYFAVKANPNPRYPQAWYDKDKKQNPYKNANRWYPN